jgi:hypothetical protein
VPVVNIEADGKGWLVAPYGIVDWVKNTRAAGMVALSRGKHSQNFALQELSPRQAAAVLKIYLEKFPITQPYFESHPDSSLAAFELDAQSRPVFELHAT